MSEPKTRRPMTPGEVRVAKALTPGPVSYTPGSADKRFARQISGQAALTEPTITEGQAAWLAVMRLRYRRQISDSIPLLEVPQRCQECKRYVGHLSTCSRAARSEPERALNAVGRPPISGAVLQIAMGPFDTPSTAGTDDRCAVPYTDFF